MTGDTVKVLLDNLWVLVAAVLVIFMQAGFALLEGGLTWQTMSLSPAEMDFAETRAAAAREIALAFGVPPMLLGIPGDNTYATYKEAHAAFWRLTVLPLVQKTARALAVWLQGRIADLRIRPQLDHGLDQSRRKHRTAFDGSGHHRSGRFI